MPAQQMPADAVAVRHPCRAGATVGHLLQRGHGADLVAYGPVSYDGSTWAEAVPSPRGCEVRCPGCGGRLRVNPRKLMDRARERDRELLLDRRRWSPFDRSVVYVD